MTSPPRPGGPSVPGLGQGRPALRRLPTPSRARRPPSRGELWRRRVLVGVAKRLLPLAAVGLLAAVALWPELERTEDRARVTFRRVTQAAPDTVRILEPRYQGVDEQNRPYNLTAQTAIQAGDSEVVELENPQADLLLNDGAWVYLEAEEGRFDRPRNHLDLTGEVTLHQDDGTQFVTEQAAVDLLAGHASGDRPVQAQGPFGTLTAEGFRLTERGQVILFTGQVRVLLEGTR